MIASEPRAGEEDLSSGYRNRLQNILNSDRAFLSPAQLQHLQRHISAALDDLMELDTEGIEFKVRRDGNRSILELSIPVLTFRKETSEEEI